MYACIPACTSACLHVSKYRNTYTDFQIAECIHTSKDTHTSYIYICMCACTHVCLMQVHMHLCTYVYVCMCAQCLHACTYVHLYVRTYAYMYVCMHECMQAYIWLCMYVCVTLQALHVCIRKGTRLYICPCIGFLALHKYMLMYGHVPVHVYMHA